MMIIMLIPIKPILDVLDAYVPFAKRDMVGSCFAIIGTVLVVVTFFAVVSTIAHLVGMRKKTVLSFYVPNTVIRLTRAVAVKFANELMKKIVCCCVTVVIRVITPSVSSLHCQVVLKLVSDK